MIKSENNIKTFLLDEDIYSKEAVALAAYVYSDKANIEYKKKLGKIEIKLKENKPINGNAADDFINEILNQQCRMDLTKKNSRVSKIIVTKALLSAAGESIR
ncbi:MAG: His-Xaa-Ser system protein HxsD [Elusimicrobiales bacterium]|nr:His-Xaa-Ser system protein HxsD [Elusimicrobiales bacterium]